MIIPNIWKHHTNVPNHQPGTYDTLGDIRFIDGNNPFAVHTPYELLTNSAPGLSVIITLEPTRPETFFGGTLR